MQITPISSNWSYLFIFGRRETLDLIVTIYQHWFYIFLLAITIHYSQGPGAEKALAFPSAILILSRQQCHTLHGSLQEPISEPHDG